MPLSNQDLVKNAYASIGRTDLGTDPGNIDQEGYNFWLEALNNGTLNEQNLNDAFGNVVNDYMVEKSNDPVENYVADYLVKSAYDDIGRSGIGSDVNQIDPGGYDFWTDAIKTGDVSATDFANQFSKAVDKYVVEKPNDPYTNYVTKTLQSRTAPVGDYLGSAFDGYLKVQQPKQPNTFGAGGVGSSYSKTTGIGAAGDEMLGAGNAQYQSPLIQALRSSSATPLSNNEGITEYKYNPGFAGSLGSVGQTMGNAANNPQNFFADAASAQDVENWNSYNTYRTNSLNTKSPYVSFSEWLTQPKDQAAVPAGNAGGGTPFPFSYSDA